MNQPAAQATGQPVVFRRVAAGRYVHEATGIEIRRFMPGVWHVYRSAAQDSAIYGTMSPSYRRAETIAAHHVNAEVARRAGRQ